jgi:hypothetical protein
MGIPCLFYRWEKSIFANYLSQPSEKETAINEFRIKPAGWLK